MLYLYKYVHKMFYQSKVVSNILRYSNYYVMLEREMVSSSRGKGMLFYTSSDCVKISVIIVRKDSNTILARNIELGLVDSHDLHQCNLEEEDFIFEVVTSDYVLREEVKLSTILFNYKHELQEYQVLNLKDFTTLSIGKIESSPVYLNLPPRNQRCEVDE